MIRPLVISLICLTFFLFTFTWCYSYANGDTLCLSGICFPLCSETPIIGSAVSGEATTQEPGGPKEYATDGNLSTYWVDFGLGSQIELDLGEPKVLCNVQLAWPEVSNRVWYYDISSVNNSKVTPIVSGTSSGNASGFEIYDLPDSVTEKIRITVNGNSLTNYSGLSEVKVFSRIY